MTIEPPPKKRLKYPASFFAIGAASGISGLAAPSPHKLSPHNMLCSRVVPVLLRPPMNT